MEVDPEVSHPFKYCFKISLIWIIIIGRPQASVPIVGNKSRSFGGGMKCIQMPERQTLLNHPVCFSCCFVTDRSNAQGSGKIDFFMDYPLAFSIQDRQSV